MKIIYGIFFTLSLTLAYSAYAEQVITLSGEAIAEFRLTRENLSKLNRKEVVGINHSGNEALYEGYDLYDILSLAALLSG